MKLIKELGFSENTRLVIVHADDAGLSHSENRATIQSLREGIVNSYSIMVPCPWFFEIAKFAKNNPRFDYGLHLTLTCEWEHYRFGPVLPVSEVPTLVDENGYFYKKRDALRNHASAEEVKRELRAQIEKALKFGLDPSHLDSHMYSVGARPDFFRSYKELGEQYALPVLIDRQLMKMTGLDADMHIEENDLVIDKTHYGNFALFEAGGLHAYYEGIFDELVNGINLILIHPAFDDDEMKGITVNHPNFGAEWRQIDFHAFTGEHSRLQRKRKDITFISWKDIKTVKRKLHTNRTLKSGNITQ